MSELGSSTDVTSLKCDVRSSPDTVAKVENRSAPKISRKLIFGRLCRCVAFQRHEEGPWSILGETISSLTSPRVKRISGSGNFCSSPQKGFCNSIPPKADVDRSRTGRQIG